MAANVNKPTNVKQKEDDINRKLQIYGIFNAFKNGKTPSVCGTICDTPQHVISYGRSLTPGF
jgi:hypothetical protein